MLSPMTTLPALPAATQIEAESLTWACAWFQSLRNWRGSDDPVTQHSPL